MKLYQDTNKELFFEQYKPLPDLEQLDVTSIEQIYDNLLAAIDNAFVYGNELLSIALYDDIVTVKRHLLRIFTVTMSSGTIANIICSTKYNDIYKALLLTIEYQEKASDESIFNQSIDYCGLCQLIKSCYNGIRNGLKDKTRHDNIYSYDDIKTEGKQMKTYHIKPEYLDMWEGGDTPTSPDRIITEDELINLSEEWETPVDEPLEQLIPCE